MTEFEWDNRSWIPNLYIVLFKKINFKLFLNINKQNQNKANQNQVISLCCLCCAFPPLPLVGRNGKNVWMNNWDIVFLSLMHHIGGSVCNI